MNRKRLSRLATVLTASAMLLASVAASPVAAKNPGWSIVPVQLPNVVAAGRNAGYFVTVTNGGTSTANAVTLTVKPPVGANQAPAYFPGLDWSVGGPEVSCTSTGLLVCDLGTLSAGETFTFTVAYLVPDGWTGTFDVLFSLESASGNTGSDGGTGNHSRGDALNITSKTAITSSTNFDAGFVVDDLLYQTTGSLGRGNKQNSTVEVTDTHLTVTVEDGNGVSTPTCTLDECTTHGIGEWTYLDVPGNDNLIKVTLNIWGGSVPGGTTTDQIVVVHVDDNNLVTVIGDNGVRCTPTTGTPDNPECITVTKIGSNFRIVAWLNENGNLRGGY